MRQETLCEPERACKTFAPYPSEDSLSDEQYAYGLLMSFNKELSDKASIEDMQKALAHYKKDTRINEDIIRNMELVLGKASTLMLRLERARDHFIAADCIDNLYENFVLAQKYGRFKLVKEFLNDEKLIHDNRFTISREEYRDLLKTRAIQHMPLFREGNDFQIRRSDLENILEELESMHKNGNIEKTHDNKKMARRKIVSALLGNLESQGNLNTPKKMFLAEYCEDLCAIEKWSHEYEMKKSGIRKNIDTLVADYCKENNMELIRRMQKGDSDDFFPISSSLYLAEDKDTHKKIVLKENLKLYVDFSRPDGYTMEKEIYEKLKDDILNKRSEAASNIVKYLGSADVGGIELLKLEFFQGERLSNYTDARKNILLPLKETITVVRKIADIINYLHSKDIIYADTKDTNILYDRNSGEIKLLDFGMARLFDNHITESTEGQSLLSTPKYVPPEVGTRFMFSKKSDVFQLGVLFYEMIRGYHPFARPELDFSDGDSCRESEIMKYSLANIVLEPQFDHMEFYQNGGILRLLKGALEKDPQKRISMTEFYERIKHIEEMMKLDKHSSNGGEMHEREANTDSRLYRSI